MDMRFTDYWGNPWDVVEIEPGSCFVMNDDGCADNILQLVKGKWRMTGYKFMPKDPKPADEKTAFEVAEAWARYWMAYYLSDDDDEAAGAYARFLADLKEA